MRKVKVIKETGKSCTIDNIDEIRAALAESMPQLSVNLVILFGSCAKQGNKTNVLSDLDIALQFDDNVSLSQASELLLRLYEALADIFKREDIDITVLNNAGVLLRYQVMRNGILLFGEPESYTKFAVASRRNYLDMLPMLNFYRNHFYRSVTRE